MSIRPNSRRLTLLLFCAVVTTPTRAQEDRAVERVLFNGNSYVYYNNLPGLVEAIAAGLNGPQLQIESHTHGGFTLQRHLDDGHAEELIRRGDSDGEPWTAVILQEQSSLGGRGRSGATAFPGSESMYQSFCHWIIVFHDETLEIVARSAQVLGRVEAPAALSAINRQLRNRTL